MKFHSVLSEAVNYEENPYLFDIPSSELYRKYIRFSDADWNFKNFHLKVYHQKINGEDHVKERFDRTDDTYRIGSKYTNLGDMFVWPDDYKRGLHRCFRKIEKKFNYKKTAYVVKDVKLGLLYYFIIGENSDAQEPICMVNTLLSTVMKDDSEIDVTHRGTEYDFEYIRERIINDFNLTLNESKQILIKVISL